MDGDFRIAQARHELLLARRAGDRQAALRLESLVNQLVAETYQRLV